MAVLEVRRADYAKLIRDFKEGRAESQSFPPELQAKPRKLQDELTGANSNFHNEITSVDIRKLRERGGLKEPKDKLSGCETRRKKLVKNIVNGYPICNQDFAIGETYLQGLTELSDENHVETEEQVHEDPCHCSTPNYAGIDKDA
ncbi:hypothetical protein BYT27DRAFT_7212941 [Phlegmacium glaucopus]|nr:hypothetical protein BYT27DRAFT_7212941 [Phlegmacium glaucopus]